MNQLHEVTTEEPHRARTRALLRAHPEIRTLFGPTPWTLPLTAVLVVVHFAIAAVLAPLPWWVGLIAAFAVGAFLSHALYAVIHESAHGLAARGRTQNEWVGLLANLPLLMPLAVTYSHYHRMHHRHQGDVDRDPDLPSPYEHRLATGGPLGKMIWHVTFPLWQLVRTSRMPRGPRMSAMLVLNAVLSILTVASVSWLLGPSALVYLGASLYFTLALHPISARIFQEHHVIAGEQETYSYYGPGNWFALNVGYHNEHHDFPAVPWTRLPRLRRLASEVYDDALVSHRSWSALFVRFFVDPTLGPLSRVVRRRKPAAE